MIGTESIAYVPWLEFQSGLVAGVQVLDSKILMSSESAWVAAQRSFAASVMTTHGLKSTTGLECTRFMVFAL